MVRLYNEDDGIRHSDPALLDYIAVLENRINSLSVALSNTEAELERAYDFVVRAEAL